LSVIENKINLILKVKKERSEEENKNCDSEE
jgi:hypothetical protein